MIETPSALPWETGSPTDPARSAARERSAASGQRIATIVVVACLCWVAAAFLFWPSVTALINMWRSDDLKSMGAIVPFFCLALVLRAWRSVGWTTRGSWWGLALLAGAGLVVLLRDNTLFVVTVNHWWLLQLPPLPLVAVLYALGLVLMLGGGTLLRAAWFPVLLMWAVVPVPQTFSRAVDLPLQRMAALVARSFAHQLGAPLTPDRLRLMFTPGFGMFIAPGCNGMRGAITLGLAAILVGYLYRFRWFVFAPVVAGAVLLGYIFNLLRLCLLVIYYKIALPYPWLRRHAETGDYIIGGALFVLALVIFFTVVNWLRERPEDVRPAPAPLTPESRPMWPYLLRAAVLVLVAVGFAGEYTYLRAALPVTSRSLPRLPEQIGSYHLVSRYNDTLVDGVVVYTWGEYAGPVSGSPHVKLGVSPVMDQHDVEVCHMIRGEDPTWHRQLNAASTAGTVSLSAFTYVDGAMQWLEASTVCEDGRCNELTQSSGGVTMVYAPPHMATPLDRDPRRPVPVLLRVETGDTSSSPAEVAKTLGESMNDFLRQADLNRLTEPYSHR